MNLLPIAIPNAAANTTGADDAATSGSGDFTALLAMLVGVASTTLPIDHAPAPSGDPAGWPALSPATPIVEAGVTGTGPELATPPVAAMPRPPVPVISAEPAEGPSAPLPIETPPAEPVPVEAPFVAEVQSRRHGPGRAVQVAAVAVERSPVLLPVTPVLVPVPPAFEPETEAAAKADAPKFGSAMPPAAVVPLAAASRAEALTAVDRPPAAPPPPSVPEQIVSAVVPLHGRGDGRHEVTLELRPDHLGTIRVEVSVEHQTVHLTLHADEPATCRLLSAALPDLRAALADAGLTAGQVGIGLNGGGGAGHRRSRPQAAMDHPLPDTSTPTSSIPTAIPAAAGRLDLFL